MPAHLFPSAPPRPPPHAVTTQETFALAFQHHQAGRLDETERLYREVLAEEPEHAEAMHLLGLIADTSGRGATAVELIEAAIRLKPAVSTYYSNLGEAYRRLGQADQAIARYQRAIELKPDYAIAHFNLANVLASEGRQNEAIIAYRKAVQVRPGFADAHFNYGNVLRNAGRFSEALEQYEAAVQARPHFAAALNNLGSALADVRGDTEGALTALRAALQSQPDFASAHLNLGNVLRECGRIPEALAEYEAALSLASGDPMARLNYGFALLLSGEMKRGWPYYEARFEAGQSAAARHGDLPLWEGQSAPGSVLMHAEQGFGDTLQFVRYAPLLAAQGARVVVECQPSLVELLRTIEEIEVVAQGDPVPACQFLVPMLSLPLAFGTELSTIPARPSYLSADPERRARWRARLGGAGRRLRVGLAWAGSPIHIKDRQRSMSLDRVLPLLSVPNVEWHSLQVGPAAVPLARHAAGGRLVDHVHELTTFADTAALVAELDLVIAVDTSIVHLAGALGRPVWTLLALAPDWRWLLERADSPWYPTMRLFRQRTAGQWAPVIDEVRRNLATLAEARL